MAMFELFHNPNYDFIGRRKWAYIISILFILTGFGSMVAKGGLRYGIDFSGGTLLQVRFDKPVPVDRIRHALETVKMGESVIQEFGDTREYLLRLPLGGEATPEEVNKQALAALAREPELSLLVMGHTHRAACATTPRGARYVNPGAWFDGFQYAVASETGAELRRFTPAAPLQPAPADRR